MTIIALHPGRTLTALILIGAAVGAWLGYRSIRIDASGRWAG